jgi:hypothetical protein
MVVRFVATEKLADNALARFGLNLFKRLHAVTGGGIGYDLDADQEPLKARITD